MSCAEILRSFSILTILCVSTEITKNSDHLRYFHFFFIIWVTFRCNTILAFMNSRTAYAPLLSRSRFRNIRSSSFCDGDWGVRTLDFNKFVSVVIPEVYNAVLIFGQKLPWLFVRWVCVVKAPSPWLSVGRVALSCCFRPFPRTYQMQKIARDRVFEAEK